MVVLPAKEYQGSPIGLVVVLPSRTNLPLSVMSTINFTTPKSPSPKPYLGAIEQANSVSTICSTEDCTANVPFPTPPTSTIYHHDVQCLRSFFVLVYFEFSI